MWKKLFTSTSTIQPWRMLLPKRHSTSVSSAVDSLLLRSLKEHYLEVSKMTPPPKISPPSGFTILKGALDTDGPVLRKIHNEEEEISVTVSRLEDLIDAVGEDDDDQINHLFIHVNVSKPGEENSLHFLCALYPDAMGINAVSIRPKLETLDLAALTNTYGGPFFHELDEKTKDALYGYIEERGVDENLFPFLQAWLYVKDHRNLMRWFKTVGSIIHEPKSS